MTPGYVAVVGAGSTSIPGAPAIPTVEDLVRGAFYLAGGLHKAIDPRTQYGGSWSPAADRPRLKRRDETRSEETKQD